MSEAETRAEHIDPALANFIEVEVLNGCFESRSQQQTLVADHRAATVSTRRRMSLWITRQAATWPIRRNTGTTY